MKKLQALLILFILTCYAAIGVNLAKISHIREQQLEQQLKDDIQNAEIEALKKDVRMLKTDVHLLQYGFEDEE